MMDFQDRVIKEHADLNEKRKKLRKFISTDYFQMLHIDEQVALAKQRNIMREYSRILQYRISAF